eukprot:RCo002820
MAEEGVPSVQQLARGLHALTALVLSIAQEQNLCHLINWADFPGFQPVGGLPCPSPAQDPTLSHSSHAPRPPLVPDQQQQVQEYQQEYQQEQQYQAFSTELLKHPPSKRACRRPVCTSYSEYAEYPSPSP